MQQTEHYGYQIILADAASLVAGVGAANGSFFLGGYLAGGPVIHLANGNGSKALASLGLRFALPASGILIGVAIAESGCDPEGSDQCAWDALGHGAAGAAVGMLAASMIDYFILATKSRMVERPRALIEVGGLHANPILAPDARGGLTLGLGGSF